MSLNIRHLTNGEKTFYVVTHTDTGERELYNTRDEVPQSIRHYAKEGEARFIEPDTARLLGVQDILYPNFPNCTMYGYSNRICIAESCVNAVPTYKDCPYYQQALKQMGE